MERTSIPLAEYDLHLFEPGLVHRLVGRGVRPRRFTKAETRLAIVALAWLPLAVLSALEGTSRTGVIPFAGDVALHVRLLVELPLFLAAAPLADALARRSVRYLFAAGLVEDARRADLRALIGRVRRVNDARVVPPLLFALALTLSLVEVLSARAHEVSWRAHDHGVTFAGWWYALVARPLVVTQFLAWFFRFGVWSWFLARAARLVHVVRAHPDGIGGLVGLTVAHHAFAVLALVIGADLASAMANRVVHLHVHVAQYRVAAAFVVVVTTLVLVAPLLVFTPALVRARLEATATFGAAGSLEARRHLAHAATAVRSDGAEPAPEVLSKAFQYQLHSTDAMHVVRESRLSAVGRRTITLFLLAVALPFLIASLTELSVGEILERIHSLAIV